MSVEAALPRPLPEGFLPPNCSYPEQDWPVLARQWFPLVRADDPLVKPRQVVLLNLRLAVYRMPDGIRIGRDMCPHRGLPLSSGRIEGEELVCAYHGLRFGSDGQCRLVPEKLAPKTADCFRITAFPAVERHGLIWTCLIPEDETWMPSISSEGERSPQDGVTSVFKLSIESLVDSQKDLALDELQRLLEELGFGSMPNAMASSGA
jgi:vanillate O-demethylase monooxygenase subunit